MALRLALLALALAGCRNFDEVTTPPQLIVSPTALTFSGPAGGDPPPQPLTVDVLGGSGLEWTAQDDVPWLTVTPATGAAPGVVWVSLHPDALGAGSYGATITFQAPGSLEPELTVPVRLDLEPAMSLTGRWAGARDTVTLSFTVTQVDTIVTGTGTLNPPLTPVTVQGVFKDPDVTLTLTAADSTVTTFAGSVVFPRAIQGTLNGGGLVDFALAVFRQ